MFYFFVKNVSSHLNSSCCEDRKASFFAVTPPVVRSAWRRHVETVAPESKASIQTAAQVRVVRDAAVSSTRSLRFQCSESLSRVSHTQASPFRFSWAFALSLSHRPGTMPRHHPELGRLRDYLLESKLTNFSRQPSGTGELQPNAPPFFIVLP